MVVGKDDLGLSLSLSCTNPTNPTTNTTTNNNINNNNHNNNNMGFFTMMNNKNNHQQTTTTTNNNNNVATTPLQLNLMMTSPSLPSSISQKLPWYRGVSGGEEEANSTVSTASGKRSSSERDSASAGGGGGGGVGDEIELERGSMSDDEDGGENSRKKLRLTKDQSAILEDSFKQHSTLNPKQKQALAKRLGLRARQVEVWFQNRRARTKLKQTEVDCEFLKGCCEKLTEENRRLQKEVHELRTLKLSPQFYMQMTPPTTLTMCPSCERVATPQAQAQAQAQAGLDSKPNIRPVPINLWGGAPVPVSVRPLPFDAFRPRS